jgi:hypothetical protein
MNYQKFLEKIIKMEHRSFEKMRLTFVLAAALVFGLVLQQVVFASEDSMVKKINTQPKKQIASLVNTKNIENFEKKSKENNNLTDIEKNTDTFLNTKNNVKDNKIKIENTKEKSIIGSSNALLFNSNPDFLPIRNYNISDIDIAAKGVVVLSEDGKILYQKNINERLPIASLTKVMSAVVILENLVDMDEIITVTKDVIEKTEGIAGRFKNNEKFRAEDLLKIMLVISSNDAAAAFEESFRLKGVDLVELMNKKAQEFGLKNTHFSNPVGFDDEENYSTAYDYANFITKVLDNKKLWDILSIKNELIKSKDSELSDRRIISSDKLAFRNIEGLFGGKTGYTQEAGGCLMVGFRVSGENGRKGTRIISVVLGAPDTQLRFDETEKLIRWIKEAYIF